MFRVRIEPRKNKNRILYQLPTSYGEKAEKSIREIARKWKLQLKPDKNLKDIENTGMD